jgi:hypothetical protein
MVPFAPLTSRSDESCLITPSEHSDVREDCSVRYIDARAPLLTQLLGLRAMGIVEMKTASADGLLRKIREGALASPHTTTGLLPAIRAALGI